MNRDNCDLGVKGDFPIFNNHPELVFLDNAATTQKPGSVIEAEKEFYEESNANVHRGVYDLSAIATSLYEGVREKIARFINAELSSEIIFTRNATEALNLAAWIEGQKLKAGDEIVITTAEHHSNILPWQRLVKERGVKIRWASFDSEGIISLSEIKKVLSKKTKLVAITNMSNVLGCVLPVQKVIEEAHKIGARVMVDAAQSAGRMATDVRLLDADYAVFSGHKIYGPTGTGWLYVKKELVEEVEPLLVGGSTIKSVTRDSVEWQDAPLRFEAGTPNIAGTVALGTLIDYLIDVGMERIWEHECALVDYAVKKLNEIEGLKLYGVQNGEGRGAIFSFTISSGDSLIHSHDVSEIANKFGVALRGGHHCAQPLMEELGVLELSRASFGLYNNKGDVDKLVESLGEVKKVFSKKDSE
jgi:cysteine desulfurase / selenocysteine lyase